MLQPIRLAIVGSRTFGDYDLLCRTMQRVKSPIIEIVSGGACGADSLAARWAREHGVPLFEILADWNTYGKRAGFIRNVDIIERADAVLAFWDGKSKGTKHDIKLARMSRKPLYVVRF